ncbi:MAG: hypothetical protein WD648_14710 [Planctomycetaceae bacterium]
MKQPKHFWANVRTISAQTGYTVRKLGQIKIPSFEEIRAALAQVGLVANHIVDRSGTPTEFGETLAAYFQYRADQLNEFVEPRLMSGEQARKEYRKLCARLRSAKCPIPLNKQKGEKKAPAFLTAIVNMLIEENAAGMPCDYDPRALTTVTVGKAPLRTLSRRVDGAFPSSVNPVAIWEIKEYYYTTTFGSRVADGVYETLLDGMELEELREHEGIDVKHYLIVDAYYTWWTCGRSYLCRILDMLHMGYVDEALFGREVFQRIPVLVKEWLRLAKSQRTGIRRKKPR